MPERPSAETAAGRNPGARGPARAILPICVGFAVGSMPFSNWAARRRTGIDLRTVGTGTVSGSGLAEVAGAGPVVWVGLLEVGKGALATLVAGRGAGVAGAWAGAAAVTGHNWSPWLRGAGGRGISPAMGALLPVAPAGSLVLLAGLGGGRLAGETALGSFLADVVLVPVCWWAHGRRGAAAAMAVLLPMLVKRLMGNAPARRPGLAVYAYRLLLDRDGPRRVERTPNKGPD